MSNYEMTLERSCEILTARQWRGVDWRPDHEFEIAKAEGHMFALSRAEATIIAVHLLRHAEAHSQDSCTADWACTVFNKHRLRDSDSWLTIMNADGSTEVYSRDSQYWWFTTDEAVGIALLLEAKAAPSASKAWCLGFAHGLRDDCPGPERFWSNGDEFAAGFDAARAVKGDVTPAA